MKMVLDTDTGIDDAVAIAMAAGSPEVELLAITSVAGNAPVALCTRNCLLMNELLGGGAIVAEGASGPLSRGLLTAQEVHGADGLGGRLGSLPRPSSSPVDEPACDLLARLPEEHPGEITLVTTGPLTNVALALSARPHALDDYAGIICMGGAFDVPGNTGPFAEFNIYVDPEAAALVLCAGLDVTLVPLDATTGAVLTRRALQSHERARGLPRDVPGADAAAILHRALDHYMEFQLDESGLDGGYMHDPLAVAAALDAGLLRTKETVLGVVTDGPERGRTVRASSTTHAATRGRGALVAFGHDEGRFLELLEERALRPVFGERSL
jgi:purine nucleosidase